MGLKLDPDFCLGNIRCIVKKASDHGVFVRIDMEDAGLCQATMDLFFSIQSEFTNVGIATHDERLVFQSLKLIDKLGLSRDQYEFQMLHGVQEDLRQILIDSGHPVRVYLPFGKEWFAYSVRRLKENPKMVGYIMANFGSIFKGLLKKAG